MNQADESDLSPMRKIQTSWSVPCLNRPQGSNCSRTGKNVVFHCSHEVKGIQDSIGPQADYSLFSSRYQAGAPLTEGVEVALDPSELELDPAAMQARLV